MKKRSFLESVAAMFQGNKPPEVGAVHYNNRTLVGPVVQYPAQNAAGETELRSIVIPVRELPRDRSKYKPHDGARQIARQRLGGFAGKPRDVIAAEIEIAKGDLS